MHGEAIMNSNSGDEMKLLTESVKKIELAILGDESIGHIGLVKQNQDHASRIKRLENIVMYGAGGIGFISLAYSLLRDFLIK
jgi:hypothetical protein